nr:hypothetical protein [Tanacetum cinerariifolium]
KIASSHLPSLIFLGVLILLKLDTSFGAFILVTMPLKKDSTFKDTAIPSDIQTLIQLTTSLLTHITAQSTAMAHQTDAINNLTTMLANPEQQQLPPLPPPPPPISPQQNQPRPPKILLPTFDGSNPLDWVFQAENYFTYYAIPPNQRIPLFVFYFTGDALSWYKHLSNNHLLGTWQEFTRALEILFGPSTYENHQATLFKLR